MNRRTFTPTNLRPWRESRGMSLDEAVALLKEMADVPLTKTSLSRIELGKQPYSQPILEGLAIVYNTTVVALLAHNPLTARASANFWEHKPLAPLPPKRGVTPGAKEKPQKRRK